MEPLVFSQLGGFLSNISLPNSVMSSVLEGNGVSREEQEWEREDDNCELGGFLTDVSLPNLG